MTATECFLQVVAFTADVAADLVAVGEAHARDLAQGRIRLLRGRGVHARAHTALLRRGAEAPAPWFSRHGPGAADGSTDLWWPFGLQHSHSNCDAADETRRAVPVTRRPGVLEARFSRSGCQWAGPTKAGDSRSAGRAYQRLAVPQHGSGAGRRAAGARVRAALTARNRAVPRALRRRPASRPRPARSRVPGALFAHQRCEALPVGAVRDPASSASIRMRSRARRSSSCSAAATASRSGPREARRCASSRLRCRRASAVSGAPAAGPAGASTPVFSVSPACACWPSQSRVVGQVAVERRCTSVVRPAGTRRRPCSAGAGRARPGPRRPRIPAAPSLNAWRISRSRWLVGSSSSSRFGAGRRPARARAGPSRRRRTAPPIRTPGRRRSRSRRGSRAALLRARAPRARRRCAAGARAAIAPCELLELMLREIADRRLARLGPGPAQGAERRPPAALDQRRLAGAVATEQSERSPGATA